MAGGITATTAMLMALLVLQVHLFGFKVAFEPFEGEISIDFTALIALFPISETDAFRFLGLVIVSDPSLDPALQQLPMQLGEVAAIFKAFRNGRIDIVPLCFAGLQ